MDYFDEIITSLQNKQHIFLTGGAGVGKTATTNRVVKYFDKESKKVAKLASTGMASTLINGQTLHSFFDFAITSSIDELMLANKFEIKPKIKKLIRSIDLLIIDEISMVSDKLFDMIELRLSQADFKGAILIVGDFLQLPPITKNNEKIGFAFESKSWKKFDFKTITLTHIYRTDDAKFIELLNHVRFAHVDEDVHNHLNSFIKPLPCDLSSFTFLFGKNISASKHNKAQLDFIDNELFIKEAQVIKHNKNIKDSEIDRFFEDARIEKQLEIKVASPILFSRNSWNYFNGERGVVVNIDEKYLYIEKKDGKVIKLEQVAQSKTKWVEKKIDGVVEMVEDELFTIYQYPIKLAFGITIHKSQGMSIEDLIIQTNEIFAPSQFYVALSRASNPHKLNLIAPSKQWRELIFVDKKAIDFTHMLS